MSAEEIEIERIPGLPGDLPTGERILWQGAPTARGLLTETFKVRWLTLYFTAMACARGVIAVQDHQPVVVPLLRLTLLAVSCVGVLAAVAWLQARATVYTITTRRVVMRVGVAVPTTWNLPFKRLAKADMRIRDEHNGDIVLQLVEPDRIAWMFLWPHAQPWHLAKARPMLRAIRDPGRVARLLADAVQAWATTEAAPVLIAATEPAVEPATVLSTAPTSPIGTGLAMEPGHWGQ